MLITLCNTNHIHSVLYKYLWIGIEKLWLGVYRFFGSAQVFFKVLLVRLCKFLQPLSVIHCFIFKRLFYSPYLFITKKKNRPIIFALVLWIYKKHLRLRNATFLYELTQCNYKRSAILYKINFISTQIKKGL